MTIVPKYEFYSLEEWIRKRIQDDNIDAESAKIIINCLPERKREHFREVWKEETDKKKNAPFLVK